jgi:hypothetical protein
MEAGEAVDLAEADGEDIRLPLIHFYLTHNIHSLLRRAIGKAKIMDNPITEERGQHEYLRR